MKKKRAKKKGLKTPTLELADKNGWPRSFWELFGTLPKDFDVGDRDHPHERRDQSAMSCQERD